MSDERETLQRIERDFAQKQLDLENAIRSYNRKLYDLQRDKAWLQEDYALGRIDKDKYEQQMTAINGAIDALQAGNTKGGAG